MKPWHEGMSDKETSELAYWERNMIALNYADGWYLDTTGNMIGWERVLSLNNGRMCFHIPTDFDIGNLKRIQPNWDGHTTDQKWENVMRGRGRITVGNSAGKSE